MEADYSTMEFLNENKALPKQVTFLSLLLEEYKEEGIFRIFEKRARIRHRHMAQRKQKQDLSSERGFERYRFLSGISLLTKLFVLSCLLSGCSSASVGGDASITDTLDASDTATVDVVDVTGEAVEEDTGTPDLSVSDSAPPDVTEEDISVTDVPTTANPDTGNDSDIEGTPDDSSPLQELPGSSCTCDDHCQSVGVRPGICVYGVCMTLATLNNGIRPGVCPRDGSQEGCAEGSRCWEYAYGTANTTSVCFPDCESYTCSGRCDGDDSCVPSAPENFLCNDSCAEICRVSDD